MKKIINLLLVLLTVSCLCACSNATTNSEDKPVEKNEVASLYEQGYDVTQSSFMENKWVAIYEKDFSMNDAYKVELDMDQETFDKLFELDTFDEEGQKQYREIIESLPGCVITSMNDLLPSEDEFDKYVGKTILDLENDGYERTGYTYDDDGCIFFLEGQKYALYVTVDEVITYETIDDYSENDIRALTIKSVECNGFSYKIFD